ncbi:nucleoside deaminase [Solitalea koreensis]|uniref:tRNA(Arg) A34 adenosine deaminase TadA n=1 Tax=Solitalea koreensis TaxID=543615 RepID=A0A521AQU2_9SPHI|nr:nucleoside deaminase [Solitalea koreensis]SMO37131.1 tRNA(Arg) A34 adenosine deaminase TadA [Solitalea koreensis]
MKQSHLHFMQQAIDLSLEGQIKGEGGPFGAIVVKDGIVVGRGYNSVCATNDPTAHAEVVAIREACKNLGTFQLTGCTIYTSCEPCPMCLGAIYWARPDKVYFGNTRQDAAEIGFDDAFIYEEIPVPVHQRKIPMIPLGREQALAAFRKWAENGDKTLH